MFASNTSQVSSDATYVEDVFSTWLYTGNGSTQTITNGIDLAGKGGLVWLKSRGPSGYNHYLYDTNRGATNVLFSNLTNASGTQANGLTAFNNNGFTQGSFLGSNGSGENYASWTFRKQPKFFDVVTYTGNGVQGRVLSHSLGSTPGFILIKETSTTGNWKVWHRGDGTTNYTTMSLNLTDAWQGASLSSANLPTSTTFQPAWIYASDYSNGNANGVSYVAYLFAHNAGGFGLTGTDNVISCGSYTGTGGTNTNSINLGYEPQWVLFKSATASVSGDWFMNDVMRGADLSNSRQLRANLSNAEGSDSPPRCYPTATGFNVTGNSQNASGDTYIYIAIRRGPMKTPTSGTSVFTPFYFAGDSSTSRQLSAGAPTDLFYGFRTIGDGAAFVDRLRGKDVTLLPAYTQADTTYNLYCRFDSNSGPIIGYDAAAGININSSAYNYRAGAFRRAPGFFDVVCYTGTGGANRQVTHNLGVQPELYIVKRRNGVKGWFVGSTLLPGPSYYMYLDLNVAQDNSAGASDVWGTSFPTSSYFVVSDTNGYNNTNTSGDTYVAYLFASCPGVSKVGSYTGNGSSQTINCGFTGGARFVLIKRTDSTGDWYVWDTARGIVSANDPRLSLNTTSAEVTTDDSIDPDNSGFIVNQVSATNINVSSATYIYLAIA